VSRVNPRHLRAGRVTPLWISFAMHTSSLLTSSREPTIESIRPLFRAMNREIITTGVQTPWTPRGSTFPRVVVALLYCRVRLLPLARPSTIRLDAFPSGRDLTPCPVLLQQKTQKSRGKTIVHGDRPGRSSFSRAFFVSGLVARTRDKFDTLVS